MDDKKKQLKEQQDIWYKKLKDEGFEDIEQDEQSLIRWDSHYFRTRYPDNTFRAKEEYYRLAGSFLHSHDFKSEKEKQVWELHAKGLPGTEIFIELRKRKVKIYKDWVYLTIRRLMEEMLEECKTPW